MKNGHNPTLKQKKIISSVKCGATYLKPENWLVIKDTPTELHIRNKETGKPFKPIKK